MNSSNITLACFSSETNEMVGMNAMTVKSKTHEVAYGVKFEIDKLIKIEVIKWFRDSCLQFEDKDLVNIFGALDFVRNKFKVYDHFYVDHYLSGIGLRVSVRGIAAQILEARANFLAKLSLTVTSTLFATIGSQKASVKAGYTEQTSTSYEEIQTNFPEVDFSGATTSHCKPTFFEFPSLIRDE